MSPLTERSLCERYHAATIYTPQSLGQHPGLNFATQPSPFKQWHQARRVELEGGAQTPTQPTTGPLDAKRLGRLLYHTYGVTLVREFPGMSAHFRAAPSAGALYPAELYVAVRGIEGIPDGILDYHAPDHSLVLCWEGDFWPELLRYTFGHAAVEKARAVLIGTGVFERSAWRYRDRAYRRVLLDTGHVFGNARIVAPQSGQTVVPLPYFVDEGVNGLLLLDGKQEGALLLSAVIDEADAPSVTSQAPQRSHVHDAQASPLEGDWIPHVHGAGALEAAHALPAEPRCDPGPEGIEAPVSLPATPLPQRSGMLESIRNRRSTRSFRASPIQADTLGSILGYAYPRDGGALVDDVLDTYVVASAVNGIAEGVYRYESEGHALTPVRYGNPRLALYDCCLRQELGRDCSFAVVHTLDLPSAVERYGERIYRTAHLQAGMIGQRLNLAALRCGFGASGIGGFFDEFVNSLLMLGQQHAVAYITTIGVPA